MISCRADIVGDGGVLQVYDPFRPAFCGDFVGDLGGVAPLEAAFLELPDGSDLLLPDGDELVLPG